MRWARMLLVGLGIATLCACGGSSPAPDRPAAPTTSATPPVLTQTAADAADSERRPCVLDARTREALELLSDELWKVGTRIGSDDASLGLQFYEASIAYGILTECRDAHIPLEASGSPQPAGAGTPATCPSQPDVIAEVQDAWVKGTTIMFQLVVMGVDAEDLEPVASLNALLMQHATELEIACGLRPPGSPVPPATPNPYSQ